MIYQTTQVMALNTRNGELRNCAISQLFQSYAYRMKTTPMQDEYVINFSEGELKIQHNLGWTDVIRITKREYEGQWLTVSYDDSTFLSVTPDTLIPAFDPTHIKVGFHGSTQFEYVLRNPERFTPEDKIRVRHPVKTTEWFKPTVSELIIIDSLPLKYTNAYSIITKSKFCNCDGILIYADDSLDVDEAKKWYQ